MLSGVGNSVIKDLGDVLSELSGNAENRLKEAGPANDVVIKDKIEAAPMKINEDFRITAQQLVDGVSRITGNTIV